jgi:hypothetical protein
MARFLLMIVLSLVLTRTFWRLVGGVLARPAPPRPGGAGGTEPPRGVQMERDPVCGTFVVPATAIALSDGSHRVYFCSKTCRDRYRAQTA